jgi:lipopolysaccharide transport system permease protein
MADVRDTRWSLVIEPRRRWFDVNVRELVRYRDLIWLFVKRDFSTVYKQTILGPLWFVLQPLLSTVVYTFVFTNLARIGTDGVPATLFYYGGTMLWSYFESCARSASDTFFANTSLFSKVYFPRLSVPISKIFSNMISLALQFATFLAFLVYFWWTGAPIHPGWTVFLFPFIVLWLALLGTGFGLIISSLTTKYRDLRQLMNFGLSLWMYATPVVYPLSKMPTNFAWVSFINPVSAPVELSRVFFYGTGFVSSEMMAVSLIVTVLVLGVGLLLFSRNEQTFIDVA